MADPESRRATQHDEEHADVTDTRQATLMDELMTLLRGPAARRSPRMQQVVGDQTA